MGELVTLLRRPLSPVGRLSQRHSLPAPLSSLPQPQGRSGRPPPSTQDAASFQVGLPTLASQSSNPLLPPLGSGAPTHALGPTSSPGLTWTHILRPTRSFFPAPRKPAKSFTSFQKDS